MHVVPHRLQLHRRAVPQPGRRLERREEGSSPTSAAGRSRPIGAKNPAELGAFKTPTVRDIARPAPYMHDGSLKTLEEVVEHYDKGGNPNPALDKDMKKLNLTDSGEGGPRRLHEGPDRRGDQGGPADPAARPRRQDARPPSRPHAAASKAASNVFHPAVQR